ncbi:ATP-dependent DNA helicase RecG [Youxingia wuxianensis]|uniref:ATP-dependent DNA helicase RecG n=1 Tax=Youxingia wuxianensis TaxID=2763678 RepID=A0A926EMG2_9FIRM|nr:ATP-dependent DNA helicase RecG [Youxingia wuxianensis]MBC8584618.1 ATP-dependent DNA helicase RecG [Youxingia wuxianensis]
MTVKLDSSVQYLKGVGEQRAKLFGKLGITTVKDLLQHYPRGYIDLSAPCEISSAPNEEICAVRGVVIKKSQEIRLKGGRKMYKVLAADDTGVLELIFFNTKYTVDALDYDTPYLFYGRVQGNLLRKQMSAPAVYPADGDQPFISVYPLTAGLSNKVLSNIIRQALQQVDGQLPELLPDKIRALYQLEEISQALKNIHHPVSMQEMERARRRFMFEELFCLAVGVSLLKKRNLTKQGYPMKPQEMSAFYEALPFILTGAQQKAIDEILSDMQKNVPANRLVQGDVGSGKTMVAMAAAYFAYLNGAQSALMAPTEILARQHYQGLSALADKLGMKTDLLVGSMTAAQKRKAKEKLLCGETDLCIGTHALLSEGVDFQNLQLVITDEQHRFGVAQRTALQEKGKQPHTLVMSATPIPRTLALMIYGELDISIIDELPPNRQPVRTYRIGSDKRKRAFGFIRDHLDQGLQAFIVCPLVEQGEEDTGLQAATEYMLDISTQFFSGYTVGLLHGKMKAADKEKVMGDFSSGLIQLLISTTVVEVGVDVPNAVIMMVENAERFGLSQLHQLRGRVGRGCVQSHCILLTDSKNPDTLQRVDMMCKSNNGFEIAEYDLKTRGPGNFLGHEQHGLPHLKIADLTTDVTLVADAQQAANEVLEKDPDLSSPSHQALRETIIGLLNKVGERPN